MKITEVSHELQQDPRENPQPSQNRYSCGTELIPVEVQAHIRHDEAQSTEILFPVGYAINNEGLINNFAIEPGIYPSKYPSP